MKLIKLPSLKANCSWCPYHVLAVSLGQLLKNSVLLKNFLSISPVDHFSFSFHTLFPFPLKSPKSHVFLLWRVHVHSRTSSRCLRVQKMPRLLWIYHTISDLSIFLLKFNFGKFFRSLLLSNWVPILSTVSNLENTRTIIGLKWL